MIFEILKDIFAIIGLIFFMVIFINSLHSLFEDEIKDGLLGCIIVGLTIIAGVSWVMITFPFKKHE